MVVSTQYNRSLQETEGGTALNYGLHTYHLQMWSHCGGTVSAHVCLENVGTISALSGDNCCKASQL